MPINTLPKIFDLNSLKQKAADLLNQGYSNDEVQTFVDNYKAQYDTEGNFTGGELSVEDIPYKELETETPLTQAQAEGGIDKTELNKKTKEDDLLPEKYNEDLLKQYAVSLLNNGSSTKEVQEFVDNYKSKYDSDGNFITVETPPKEVTETKNKALKREDLIPEWIRESEWDFLEGIYFTITNQFPQAFKGAKLGFDGAAMKSIDREIAELDNLINSGLDPNTNIIETDYYNSYPTSFAINPATTKTIQQRYDELKGKQREYPAKILSTIGEIADLQEEAKVFNDPKVFDEDGLTFDDLGGIVGRQVPQVASAVLSFGLSAFAQEYGHAYIDNLYAIAEKEFGTQTPTEDQLLQLIKEDKDQQGVALATGAIAGSLEFVGAKGIAGALIKTKAVRSLIRGEFKKTLAQSAGDIGKLSLKGGLTESLTEGGQDVVADIGRGYTIDDYSDVGQHVPESMAQGGIVGVVLPGLGGSMKVTRDGYRILRNGENINNEANVAADGLRTDQQKEQINENARKLSRLQDARKSADLSQLQKDQIERVENDIISETEDVIQEPYRQLTNVNEQGIKDIYAINEEITSLHQEAASIEGNPLFSDDVKKVMVDELDKRIATLTGRAQNIIKQANEQNEINKQNRIDEEKERVRKATNAKDDNVDSKLAVEKAEEDIIAKIVKEEEQKQEDPISTVLNNLGDVTETTTDQEGVAGEQEVPATTPKQEEVSPTEPKTKEEALANLREKQKAFSDLEDQIKPDEPGSPSTFALHDARVELDKAKDIVKKFTAKPIKEDKDALQQVQRKTEKSVLRDKRVEPTRKKETKKDFKEEIGKSKVDLESIKKDRDTYELEKGSAITELGKSLRDKISDQEALEYGRSSLGTGIRGLLSLPKDAPNYKAGLDIARGQLALEQEGYISNKNLRDRDAKLSEIATTKIEGPVKSAEFQKTIKEASKVPGFVIDLTKAETTTKGKALPAARPAFYENTQAQTSLDVLSAIQQKYKSFPLEPKTKEDRTTLTREEAYDNLIDLFNNAGYTKTSPVVKALQKGKKETLPLKQVVENLSKSIKKTPEASSFAPSISKFDKVINYLDKEIEGWKKEGDKFKGTLGMNSIVAKIGSQAVVKGLQGIRFAIKEGRPLFEAIDKGYEYVKNKISSTDWNKAVSDIFPGFSKVKITPAERKAAKDKLKYRDFRSQGKPIPEGWAERQSVKDEIEAKAREDKFVKSLRKKEVEITTDREVEIRTLKPTGEKALDVIAAKIHKDKFAEVNKKRKDKENRQLAIDNLIDVNSNKIAKVSRTAIKSAIDKGSTAQITHVKVFEALEPILKSQDIVVESPQDKATIGAWITERFVAEGVIDYRRVDKPKAKKRKDRFKLNKPEDQIEDLVVKDNKKKYNELFGNVKLTTRDLPRYSKPILDLGEFINFKNNPFNAENGALISGRTTSDKIIEDDKDVKPLKLEDVTSDNISDYHVDLNELFKNGFDYSLVTRENFPLVYLVNDQNKLPVLKINQNVNKWFETDKDGDSVYFSDIPVFNLTDKVYKKGKNGEDQKQARKDKRVNADGVINDIIGNKSFREDHGYAYRGRDSAKTLGANHQEEKYIRERMDLDPNHFDYLGYKPEDFIPTQENIDFLKAKAADSFGAKLEAFEDRVDFTNRNWPTWKKWAKDPEKYGKEIFIDDDRFEFFHNIVNLLEIEEGGDNFITGAIVNMDESASGPLTLSLGIGANEELTKLNGIPDTKLNKPYLDLGDGILDGVQEFSTKEINEFNKFNKEYKSLLDKLNVLIEKPKKFRTKEQHAEVRKITIQINELRAGDKYVKNVLTKEQYQQRLDKIKGYEEIISKLKSKKFEDRTDVEQENLKMAYRLLQQNKEATNPILHYHPEMFWKKIEKDGKLNKAVKKMFVPRTYMSSADGMAENAVEQLANEAGFEFMLPEDAQFMGEKVYNAYRKTYPNLARLEDVLKNEVKSHVESIAEKELDEVVKYADENNVSMTEAWLNYFVPDAQIYWATWPANFPVGINERNFLDGKYNDFYLGKNKDILGKDTNKVRRNLRISTQDINISDIVIGILAHITHSIEASKLHHLRLFGRLPAITNHDNITFPVAFAVRGHQQLLDTQYEIARRKPLQPILKSIFGNKKGQEIFDKVYVGDYDFKQIKNAKNMYMAGNGIEGQVTKITKPTFENLSDPMIAATEKIKEESKPCK